MLDDARAADLRRRQGWRVKHANGIWWTSSERGLWHPVNELRKLTHEQLRWPTRAALGFFAAPADPADVTGTKSGHLLAIDDFGEHHLSRKRRQELRRALVECEFRVLDSPELLLKSGWEVASAGARKSGAAIARDRRTYQQRAIAAFETDAPMVICALKDEELIGYMSSIACDRQACLDQLYISPQSRSTGAGAGLYWLTLDLWSQVSEIDQVWLGTSLGSDSGVDWYKGRFGAPSVEIPIHAQVRWAAGLALARMRPDSLLLKAAGR